MKNLVAGIVVSLGLGLPVFSQTYTMSNGSVSACSGTFYDNGGTGNYSNNQTLTYTICPSVAGNRVMVNFTAFALENNYDFLTIYDGSSTSAPTLGTYTGATGPGLVSATSVNASGCLTFVFISNSSNTAAGWTASVSCAAPCQNITANLNSTTPAAGAGSIIRICQGQSVTFNGSGTFSNNGAGASYLWNFGDGTTASGTSVTHTFTNAGSYQVKLDITDASGCHNSNHLNQIVQVSTTPLINLTASPVNLCVGATSALNATVTPTPFSANCAPPVSGTTFLPDGSGVSYTTSVNVNCYGTGQTITNSSDIQSVCLNLEHSYLGDLRIRLICPNGQAMTLKAYPGGGGTYLGSPLDDPAVGPGTGATYCFTPSASTLLVNGPTITAGSPAGNSIAPGNYMPVDPFSNMTGCPLNGAWTIEVTDNLGVDNGYIFNWDISFAPSLAPAGLSFTPAIVSQGWVSAPGLTSVNATQANAVPATPGSNCYTYSVTDNFGCTYTQNICLNATAGPTVTIAPSTLTICEGQTINLSASGATSYSWTGPNSFSAGNTSSITIPNAGVTAGGTYTATGVNASGCSTSVTRNVIVNPLPATPNFTTNSPLCNGAALQLNGPTIVGATYIWNGPNGFSSALEDPSVGSVSAASAGTYSLYVIVNGCTSATATQNVTVYPVPATPNFTSNSPLCAGNTLSLNGPTIAGATYVWSGPNGFSSALEDPSISSVTSAASGTYSLYVVVNGCTSATATQNITIYPLPAIPNFTTNGPLCNGQQLDLYGPNVAGATYVWSGPNGFTQSGTNANVGNVTAANAGIYSLYVVVNGCTSATATQNVVINPVPAVPNFTVNTPLCAGNTLNLNGPPLAGATYVWSGPNGFSSALEDPSISSVTTAASGTYSLYLVISGCSSGTATQNVTVYPVPATPNFTSNSPLCAGNTLSLNGPTIAGATYVWSGPNGFSSALEDPSISSVTSAASGTYSLYLVVNGCTSATATQNIVINPLPIVDAGADQTICIGAAVTLSGAGALSYTWDNGVSDGMAFNPTTTTTYTVTGTDANNCQNTDQLNVTVNPLPVVDAGADQTICIGAAVTLSGAGALSYTWDNGVTDGMAFNPTTTTTYTVTGTDANNCQNTDQLNVTVNPLPVVDAGADQTICIGAAVTLSGAGALSYTWDNGVTDGMAFNPTTTTTYTVTGTDANNCQNTDQLNVTVNPLPIVDAGADQTICIGAAVTVNGTGALSYTWDNGVSDGMAFNPTTTTTYTVTGTDANNCQNTDQLTVTVNPLPIVDAGADQTICIGAAVTVNGTGALSYTWDNGVSDGMAFNPTATTTYTVTGTDANNCQNTDQLTVTVNPLPLVDAGADQTICIGAAVTVNGTGALSYTWDNGVSDGMAFNPTTTTTYTVTGTDANNCQNTDQLTVTVNPLPIVDAGADQTICIGAAVTLSGAGALSYTWDNGVTDGMAFNPTATTTYTVTGTDANNCQNTDQLTVTVNPLPIVDAGADQTICIGAAVTVNGTGALSYTWDNGVTDGMAFNPTATTTYTVTGTDANNCQNTDQLTVTVNPLPIVDAGADQTICIGAAVTLSGAGALSYTWDNGVSDGIAFNPTTTTTYTVTGTDANNCQNTDQLTVTVNPLPIVDAGADQTICIGAAVTLSGAGALSYTWDNGVSDGMAFNPTTTTTYTVTGTDANNCQNTDQLTVTVNPLPIVDAGADQTICIGAAVTLNGAGALSYTWDNGVTDGMAFNPTTTTTYTVTGTDANNCQNTDQLTVTVNPLPIVDAGADQTICIGAAVTLNGSGALSYTWDNGVSDGMAFNPTATYTYTVTGTDANNCQNTDQLTVTVNPLPIVDAGADQTICIGAAVTLSGAGALSYTWDNGVSDGMAFNPTTTTTYTVTGTDANNCQNTDQLTVTVNPLPIVDAGADQTICIGAAVTLNGSGALSYTWDNGVTDGMAFNPTTTTTYTVTGTDANNCQNTDQLTVTVNPLPVVDAGADQTICIGAAVTLNGSGALSYTWDNGVSDGMAFNPTATTTYTVTGTDANNCQNTDQLTVTVNPLPIVDAGADQTICIGAAVTLNGSGALSYTWDNGVSDGMAFNPTTTTTYTVTGTDANNCQNTDQLNVTVNPLPLVDAGADQTICIGAAVTLSGAGALSYTWDNGVTDGMAFNPTATTTYTVTGTDANNCQNTDQLTVTVNPLPIVDAGADQTICIGAAVTLSGAGALSYTWDNGVSDGMAFNPTTTTTYTVTGTDANNCQNTDQLTITVNPLPVVDAGADQTICIGAAVTLAGTGAVSYTWDNGVTDGMAFNPTTTTTYTVTGTDANNCQNTDQLTVTVNPLPIVDAGADQTICIGAAVTLAGTGAVSYTWDNGVTDGMAFNPTTTTTYTVTGTDANNCQNTDQLTVTVNPLPIVDAGADQTICIGAAVTLNGSGALSYTWDNGVSDGMAFNPTTTTTYTVTGTDANNCQNTDQLNVTVNPLPLVDAGADQTICIGAAVTLSGAGALSYTWDNGVTDGMAFNPTATTTYTVTGTDANNCQNTDQLTVTVNPLPIVDAGADQTICIGAAVTLSGAGALSYTWDNGVSDGMAFNPTTTTTYTVTGTDANNCQNTDQLTITVNPLPIVDAGADQTICIGAAVTLSGAGALSYTWDNGVSDGMAFNPTATTTYTVTGTDANNCQNTDQLNVTVNPLPIVDAGADQTICIGAAVTLSGAGALSYTWDNGVSDGMAFNPTATTTYTVTGTDANNCQNTDQLTVTVNPLPIVDAGADQTICIGAAVTVNGTGALSYTWDNGVSDGMAFNPTTTTIYTVTGTDANNCQNTDQLTVTVNLIPPTPVISASTDYCAGENILLDANTIPGASYQWLNPAPFATSEDVGFNNVNVAHSGTYSVYVVINGCISDTAQHTLTVHPTYNRNVQVNICEGSSYSFLGVTYQNSGQYLVSLTTNQGCDSLINLHINLMPQPVAGFDMPGQISEEDPSVEISDASLNATSVQYLLSTGDIYNIPDFVYTFMAPGTYSILQITTNGACIDSVSREITITPVSMTYIPNSFTPDGDGINDEWKPVISYTGAYTLLVFDRWGELIFQSDNVYKGWNGNFMNMPDKPVQQGTYVYKIHYTEYQGNEKQLLGHINLLR